MGTAYDLPVFTEATGEGQGCAGQDDAATGPRETISLQPKPVKSFEVESPVRDEGLAPEFMAWFHVDLYDPADAAAVRAMSPALLRFLPDGSPMVFSVRTRRVGRPAFGVVPAPAAACPG